MINEHLSDDAKNCFKAFAAVVALSVTRFRVQSSTSHHLFSWTLSLEII